MFKVESLRSPSGNKVANQFELKATNGYIFQSYNSLVAAQGKRRKVINNQFYKYSSTTTKYTTVFFHLRSAKELHQDVKNKNIELLDQKAFDKFLQSIK